MGKNICEWDDCDNEIEYEVYDPRTGKINNYCHYHYNIIEYQFNHSETCPRCGLRIHS